MCKSGMVVVFSLVVAFAAIVNTATPSAALSPKRDARVTTESARTWRTDPAWHQGKAEWALYDAQRVIYNKPRKYEATIFTNKQHMSPNTTMKTTEPAADSIEVFKHNLSEVIPTEKYAYRFLTTCFVRTGTMEPYKVVMSSQEDCGATYRRFRFDGGDRGRVHVLTHCYFPDGAEVDASYRLPGESEHFRFHDDLTLSLRDFPFDDPKSADVMMKLIADQTNTRNTPTNVAEAQIHYEGRQTLDVPYGSVDTHHLRITHEPTGGVSESHYWFAADADDMRHVMVQYEGPWGVKYRLKRLEWWAYWADPMPK